MTSHKWSSSKEYNISYWEKFFKFPSPYRSCARILPLPLSLVCIFSMNALVTVCANLCSFYSVSDYLEEDLSEQTTHINSDITVSDF